MKLKEQLRRKIKVQGKSRETFKTYWHWCENFIRFSYRRLGDWELAHPEKLCESDVELWLTDLAVNQHVAKNSQNLALQSVCYLYRHVLGRPLVDVSAIRAKRPQQVRDVISIEEVGRLFSELEGASLLVAQIMYASGLRIGKALSLRVKDISFERCQLNVKTAKGDKGRYTSFPEVLHPAVKRQIESMRVLHRMDLEQNPNGVSLPDAFRRKSPRAASEFRWYYLFCSDTLSRDDDGVLCRHHRHSDHIARQIKAAADRAEIDKRVTSHVLRHSYATHAHEMGVPIRTLQVLLGHSSVETTEIYVHADKNLATASKSPIEALAEQLANPVARKRPALRVFAG